MKNSNFGKTGENVQNYKDIKFLTAEKRRNSSASEANYYITKFFTEKILTLEVKKTQILMNKLVYLGHSQYYNWEKLQYMSFGMIRKNMVKKKNFLMRIKIVLLHTWYMKADDIYKDIAKDIKTRFDNAIYELNKPLLKE